MNEIGSVGWRLEIEAQINDALKKLDDLDKQLQAAGESSESLQDKMKGAMDSVIENTKKSGESTEEMAKRIEKSIGYVDTRIGTLDNRFRDLFQRIQQSEGADSNFLKDFVDNYDELRTELIGVAKEGGNVKVVHDEIMQSFKDTTVNLKELNTAFRQNRPAVEDWADGFRNTIEELSQPIKPSQLQLDKIASDVDRVRQSIVALGGSSDQLNTINDAFDKFTKSADEGFESTKQQGMAMLELNKVIRQTETEVTRYSELWKAAEKSISRAEFQTAVLVNQVKRVHGVHAPVDQLTLALSEYRAEVEKGAGSSEALANATDKFNKKIMETRMSLDNAKVVNKSYTGSLENLSKSIVLALGPLSGVASRVTAFTSLVKSNTVALAALTAASAGMVVGIYRIVNAGTVLEKQLNTLRAVISATGREAEASSYSIQKMAAAVDAATLANLDEVRHASTILLRYRDISVNAFQDILLAAQGATAAFGGRLLSNTRQIARAMEEPAKNINSLGEVGIQYSKVQQQLVKDFENLGLKVQAQNIIMSRFAVYQEMAKSQSQGLSGEIATLGTHMLTFWEKMSTSSGVIDTLAHYLARINEGLDRFINNTSGVTAVTTILVNVIKVLGEGIVFVTDNLDVFMYIVGGALLASIIKVTASILAWAAAMRKASEEARTLAAEQMKVAAGADGVSGSTAKASVLLRRYAVGIGAVVTIGSFLYNIMQKNSSGMADYNKALRDSEGYARRFGERYAELTNLIGQSNSEMLKLTLEGYRKELNSTANAIGIAVNKVGSETGKLSSFMRYFGVSLGKAYDDPASIFGLSGMTEIFAAAVNEIKDANDDIRKDAGTLTGLYDKLTEGISLTRAEYQQLKMIQNSTESEAIKNLAEMIAQYGELNSLVKETSNLIDMASKSTSGIPVLHIESFRKGLIEADGTLSRLLGNMRDRDVRLQLTTVLNTQNIDNQVQYEIKRLQNTYVATIALDLDIEGPFDATKFVDRVNEYFGDYTNALERLTKIDFDDLTIDEQEFVNMSGGLNVVIPLLRAMSRAVSENSDDLAEFRDKLTNLPVEMLDRQVKEMYRTFNDGVTEAIAMGRAYLSVNEQTIRSETERLQILNARIGAERQVENLSRDAVERLLQQMGVSQQVIDSESNLVRLYGERVASLKRMEISNNNLSSSYNLLNSEIKRVEAEMRNSAASVNSVVAIFEGEYLNSIVAINAELEEYRVNLIDSFNAVPEDELLRIARALGLQASAVDELVDHFVNLQRESLKAASSIESATGAANIIKDVQDSVEDVNEAMKALSTGGTYAAQRALERLEIERQTKEFESLARTIRTGSSEWRTITQEIVNTAAALGLTSKLTGDLVRDFQMIRTGEANFKRVGDEANKTAKRVEGIYESFFQGLESTATSGFASILEGNAEALDNMLGEFVDLFRQTLAQMAVEALKNQIILPMVAQITGVAGEALSGALGAAGLGGPAMAGIAAAGMLVVGAINRHNAKDDERMHKFTAEYVQANQNIGTILGDALSTSESLSRGIGQVESVVSDTLSVNFNMLKTLISIDRGINKTAAAFASERGRGFGTQAIGGSSRNLFDTGIYGAFNKLSLGMSDMVMDFFNAESFMGQVRQGLATLTFGVSEVMMLGLDKVFGSVGSFISSTKVRVIDSGIRFTAQNISEILEDGLVDVMQYTRVRIKKKRFGVSSSKRRTYYDEVSEVFSSQLGDVFIGAFDALNFAAETFNIDISDEIMDALNIEARDLSLHGLKGDDLTKAFEDFFNSIFDNWTETVLDMSDLGHVLLDFQEVGEGAFQTFMRLATETNYLVQAMRNMGKEIGVVGEDLLYLTQDLADMAGGFDNLQSIQSSYYDNFFSDAEKVANLQNQLTEEFERLGLTLPSSIQGYRDLVDAQDLTTEEGKELYIRLLEISDAFFQVEKAAEALDNEAAKFAQNLLNSARKIRQDIKKQIEEITGTRDIGKEIEQAFERLNSGMIEDQLAAGEELLSLIQERYRLESEAIAKLNDMAKTLIDTADSLLLSNISILDPAERLAEAQSQYEEALAAARLGDEQAIADFNRLASEYAQIAREFYASSQGYTDIFTKIQDDLRGMAAELQQSAGADYESLEEALREQTLDDLAKVEDIMAGIEGVITAMSDFDAWGDITKTYLTVEELRTLNVQSLSYLESQLGLLEAMSQASIEQLSALDALVSIMMQMPEAIGAQGFVPEPILGVTSKSGGAMPELVKEVAQSVVTMSSIMSQVPEIMNSSEAMTSYMYETGERVVESIEGLRADFTGEDGIIARQTTARADVQSMMSQVVLMMSMTSDSVNAARDAAEDAASAARDAADAAREAAEANDRTADKVGEENRVQKILSR